jgi:hypothetical protein
MEKKARKRIININAERRWDGRDEQLHPSP